MPEDWAELYAELDVKYLQFSYDLLDPVINKLSADYMAGLIRDAVKKHGLELHSAFTGLAAYSFNLLTHPDPLMRADFLYWYKEAIDIASSIKASAVGGHIAAKSINDNSNRKEYLDEQLFEAIRSLRVYAEHKGLKLLLWEPMPVPREPPWSMEEAYNVLKQANIGRGIPLKLNIDLGHSCTLTGKEANPYEWLRALAKESPSIHIQQTDGVADRHWPFAKKYNERGIIRPDKVLEAIDESGANEVYLFLEYIPPFEEADDLVLKNLKESVKYWKNYL